MKKHELTFLNSRAVYSVFWELVQKTPDCHLWVGRRNAKGYGTFQFYGDYLLAHRASWIMQAQQLPGSMLVLHSCDVRNCVNPDHLRLGTQSENVLDMYNRGRAAKPSAKLTQQQIIEIRTRRKNGERGNRLAEEYGITPHQIAAINTGRVWKDVP